jgi:hypothetical protein
MQAFLMMGMNIFCNELTHAEQLNVAAALFTYDIFITASVSPLTLEPRPEV